MFVNETDMLKHNVICKSSLINDYGFTDKLIKNYLPAPILKKNPYYRAHPMKVWTIETLMSLKDNSSFIKDYEQAQKRKATAKEGAKKGIATKEKKYISSMGKALTDIEVTVIPIAKVLHNAIISWEERNESVVSGTLDTATKERWMVNYIRHNLTVYDETLYYMPSKTGKKKAYSRYRNNVLDAIAKAYPKLKKECERQKGVK